jgi:two-component system, OmpR family, sensor kinase
VNVSVFSRLTPASGGHGTILSTTLMALGVIGFAIVFVRWVTKPLSTVADAAQKLYRGADEAPVPEEGPREVRELATAFNDMQGRIRQLISDRSQALAAVSHDLKTPITRLRLKVEGLTDGKLATSILGDLAEMEEMLDQTLAYLRGDREDEPFRKLDLAALVQTLTDDAADAGGDARCTGGPLTVEARPLALKRALANLIGNALKYGGAAGIDLRPAGDVAVVIVDDNGPGIPPDQIEQAFQPFSRLEASRNRDTGGFGLGLAIARAVINGHGGELTLANRPEGGLRATVRLPLQQRRDTV